MKRISRDLAVERLRWTLLAALSGVSVGMTACAGRSERTDDQNQAGEENASGGHAGSTAQGGSGNSPGTGGTGTGGTGGVGAGGSGTAGTTFGGNSGVPGTGGATAGSGGTGVAGGAGEPPTGCAAAAAYTDESGNLVACDKGFVHRPEVASCAVPDRYGPDVGGAGGAGGEGGSAGEAAPPPIPHECATDFDCTAQPNGFCLVTQYEPSPEPMRHCAYACTTDADCGAGNLCACEGKYTRAASGEELTLGTCRTAGCTSDADCNGTLCISPVDSACGTPRPSVFHCQDSEDECSGSGDCQAFEQCTFDGSHFICQGRPVCGRPFVVHGAARVAPAAAGSDWSSRCEDIDPGALDPDLRAEVARHYVAAGLMEHASIAAFARFALQLLALGAPPELLDDTTRAQQDETRHARLCFGLAARYSGRSAGPGALDLSGALENVSLLKVADLVIAEGCLGETGAALEAAWAAEAALDPRLKALLSEIAGDELRHATLAFRFVAWAARQDARVKSLFARRVSESRLAAEAALAALPAGTDPRAELLARHGVLDERTRAEARLRALDDIVAHASAALTEPAHFTSSMTVESQPKSSSIRP